MDTILAYVAGGGLLWLLLWIALLIAALICAAYERPGIFTLFLGVVFCLAIAKSDFALLNWALAHKALIIAISGAYVIAGVLWSFFKWDRLCAHEAERQRIVGGARLIPQASMHKGKFSTWILLWWASIIDFVIADVAIEIRDWVLRQFSGVYAAIAQRHFKP